MEKYGFVYLWFDKKHKRYYVGCHWGTEDDGYVCSSSNMKSAYKRRPNDFRRRVLTTQISSKKQLLEEEYKWLSKIKVEELGKKYYNLHNHHFEHWSTELNAKLSTTDKMKLAWQVRKESANYAPPRLNNPAPMRPTAKSRLVGAERTVRQKAAAQTRSEKMKGVKRGNYVKEHGEKISNARRGKSTGIVPKTAFKKGNVPWNKRTQGEDYGTTKGK